MSDDPYNGHEFAHEPATDLFRCVRCAEYEVVARNGDSITPCPGERPEGTPPLEVNMY